MSFSSYGHFWYSEKQRRVGQLLGSREGWNYALIDGREVRYTEWTDCTKDKSNWDDAIYLGYGRYSGYREKSSRWDNLTNREFLTKYFNPFKIEEQRLKDWVDLATRICIEEGTNLNLKSTTTCGTQEVDMNERMTRKELTEKVRELERELGRRLFDIKDLRQRLNLQLAKIEDLEDDRVSFKRFQALIEFLGLESQYVCGTEGRYEFSKKKVRKPYTRK